MTGALLGAHCGSSLGGRVLAHGIIAGIVLAQFKLPRLTVQLDLFAGSLVDHLGIGRFYVDGAILVARVLLDHHGLRYLELALINVLRVVLELEVLALAHLLTAEQSAAEATRVYDIVGDVVVVEALEAEFVLLSRRFTRLIVVSVAAGHDGNHGAEHEASLGEHASSAAVMRAS